MLNKQDEKLLQELLKKYKQGIISGLYQGSNVTFTPTGCRDKIISSTSSGTGGGIQSIQEGDNITVDNTDPQNPIISATGGGSSELFPNGFSEETVSRELTSADIGKLLIIVNDDVILTPASDMVSTGDLPKKFGIWCLNPTTKTSGFKVNTPSEICYLESATAFDGATGSGEIVSFMTLYDDDLVTSNIYPITDIMLSTEFTGTVGQLAIPYLLEQSQNAIPLSGTKVGKPVTGDIEIEPYNGYSIKSIDGLLETKINTGNLDDIGVEISHTNGVYYGSIQVTKSGINILSNDPSSKGLIGDQDFTPNITDLDYTQKKYVDNEIITLDYGDIVAVGGVQNIQVYTTGTGTGTASVDLLPNIQIGKDVTVSDLGNNASTHNIQIDSGSGNTILVAGSSPSQDITLNTNGASVTIRRMTSTQFMVIAKN